MGQRIQQIDCFVIETSLIATLRGSPEFAEVVCFMNRNGYVLFEIIDILRRPLDHALAQIDAVFVKQDSELRRDHRWAG
jgi:hypothetical protein